MNGSQRFAKWIGPSFGGRLRVEPERVVKARHSVERFARACDVPVDYPSPAIGNGFGRFPLSAEDARIAAREDDSLCDRNGVPFGRFVLVGETDAARAERLVRNEVTR